MQFRLQILLSVLSISLIGAFNVYEVDAKLQKTDPEIVDYHLKLAQGILETCYIRDPDTDNLIPNPTLPLLSDIENTCQKKMRSLDNFLAKFVGDEDGKIYADHIANESGS